MSGFVNFFIDRPIFASVVSIIILLAGVLALRELPIAQFPEISPPTIQLSANYPGANALVMGETVASPIEEQINGAENMLYLSSTNSNTGQANLTATFAIGSAMRWRPLAGAFERGRLKPAALKSSMLKRCLI